MGLIRAFVMVLCSLISVQNALADDSFAIAQYVVEPDASAEGATQSQLANAWWQWAASMPPAQSPVRDMTGAKCGVNQKGLVWNLAGGYGSSKISRTCTVPIGQYIFFPVINMLVSAKSDFAVSCDAVKAEAARNNDPFVYIRVSVNGVEIPNAERFRIASQDCFDLMADNPDYQDDVRSTSSATDGYWILLRPLPVGEYRLEFKAFYANADNSFGDMVQNIGYDLTVAEP